MKANGSLAFAMFLTKINKIYMQSKNVVKAAVPPYLPDLEIIPIEFVVSIHFFGVRVKLLEPDSFLNASNSMRKSRNFAMSVRDINSSSFCL